MNYEERYKALCYLLAEQFNDNGYRYSMFDEEIQDLLLGFILDGIEDKEESKKCYEKAKGIMDRC